MNEEPELASGVKRVNGFAPGDRVAIVNCELAGAYGKVTDSWSGCEPDCREDCYIVRVELMSKPEGVKDDWWRMTWPDRDSNVRRFMVREVTHVD